MEEHPEEGDEGNRNARVFGFENQKGIAGVAQAEKGNDQQKKSKLIAKRPESEAKIRGRRHGQGRLFFFYSPEEDDKSDDSGEKSQPEDGPILLGDEGEQQKSDQRADYRSGVVHGALEAEGLAFAPLVAGVGNQSVPGGGPNSFANSVEETNKQDMPSGRSRSDQRPDEG